MISLFPVFTEINIGHKTEIEAITSKFEPYADFSFVNLFAWAQDAQTEIALLNDNLVVRLPDYIKGDSIVYSFIGNNMVDESIDALLSSCGQLSLVPEVVTQRICAPSRYCIIEDRDNSDYIYDVHSLASMMGGEYKKKRNKVNGFKKDLGNVVATQALTNLDAATTAELRTVFAEWVSGCHKTYDDCESERRAIERMLENVNQLNLLFTVVRANGKICAFSVNELYDDGKAICHFEKAIPIHENLYAFTIHYTAQELERRGVKEVNWQQDLGLPGLRHAKTSYHPSGFLKKYTVSSA